MSEIRRWSAPAEVSDPAITEGCDCFWHRRIFTHISIGPAIDADGFGQQRQRWIPLQRRGARINCGDGKIEWVLELPIEGALFEVRRLVHPQIVLPIFHAIVGDPRKSGVAGGEALTLQPYNDHSRRCDGGDPVLLWQLPERIGAARFPAGSNLIVWPEAWWWRLGPDGRDPLAEVERWAPGHAEPGNWSLLPSPREGTP